MEKVARNKPAAAVDTCWTESGEKIVGEKACLARYPISGHPRTAAGEGLADDVLKCQLKPIGQTGYSKRLDDRQLAKLREIFPQGVCDYSMPGVGQQSRRPTSTASLSPGSGAARAN